MYQDDFTPDHECHLPPVQATVAPGAWRGLLYALGLLGLAFGAVAGCCVVVTH